MELGEVTETVDYGLKAVELLPESADAHLAYAKAVGFQLAKETKGLAGILAAMTRIHLFRDEALRVIELNPDDVEARTMLTLYYLAPMPVGDVERAFELCREIVERDPVAGKQLLALCHERDGDVEQAIEVCEEGIEEFPDEAGFRVTLADLYAGEERFADADREYAAARLGEKDEDYYRSMYSQARMHVVNESDPALALELLDEYVAGAPLSSRLQSLAAACWRRGNALEQLGRVDEARAAYEESLRRDPTFEEARDSLDALDD
jgi:tetratricopeptide (TPR) repeat protein